MLKLTKLLVIFLLIGMAILVMTLVLRWRLAAGLAKRVYCWSRGIDTTCLLEPPLAKTEAEKRILTVLDDVSKGPNMGRAAPALGRLLRILVEAVDAKNVIEIGTSQGYSALWICLGLQSTNGKLITHEIDPQRVALATANFQRAGVENFVTVVEGDAHETVKNLTEPIDLLFIDAEKSGYFDYLNKLLPLVRPGGLILADAANKPTEFPDFIKAISTTPNLETVGLNMWDIGISLSIKRR
jgi:caffeoyl-CoA O-methyltransferase